MIDNSEVFVIYFADVIGHSIADQHMLFVSNGSECVGTLASFQVLYFFGGPTARDVENLYAITTRQTDEQKFVVRRTKHVGGHGAGFDSPFDGLRGQINGHQFIAVLHGGPHRGAFAVNPQVAWRFRRQDALDQDGVLTIPFVNVNVIESIGNGHKPLHVGRKSKVIRIQNTWNDALNLRCSGVDECQGV